MSELSDPIVVTGIGALGAGARGGHALFEVALAGQSVGEWVALPGLDEPVAASRAPDPELLGPELRYARRLDRAAQLAYDASRQAVDAAGLRDGIEPERIGVLIGTSRGPLTRNVDSVSELQRGATPPTASAESTPASLSGIVSQAFGFAGPSATVSATCASAATAFCLGALHLLADEVDAMVVGGSEASLVAVLAAQLRAARVTGWNTDPKLTCRPFDADRNGLMLGEGAAAMVLERRSCAERRGVSILARLSGWACGSDAGGRTGVTADGEGLVRVMRHALARAGLKADGVGYVNAHGTATRLNDPVESRALNAVFGPGCVPPVSSTKPITGHCLGATPALEAVIAVEALRAGCLPPTPNLARLDPECAIDAISGEPRMEQVSAVLSTSMGFWGTQAALIFEAA
jgi:3-oxoacyl-(acyl-carrier-protein) synthase